MQQTLVDTHHPSVQTDLHRYSTYDNYGATSMPYTVLDSILERNEEHTQHVEGKVDISRRRKNMHKMEASKACCGPQGGGCLIM